MRFQPLAERLEAGTFYTDSCWIWSKAAAVGYGVLWDKGRSVGVHRVAWELRNGEIPNGLCILHRCDVSLCVNPEHMFLGSKGENNVDRANKGRSNRGEDRPQAKLTEERVREILADERPKTEIAKDYGVSRSVICSVKRRTTWRHVEKEMVN